MTGKQLWDCRLRTAGKIAVMAIVAITVITINVAQAEQPLGGDDAPYATDDNSSTPVASEPQSAPVQAPAPAVPARKPKPIPPKKYFIPDTQRTDAGLFHVAFAAGGNFYIEPQLNASTGLATGNYFKDFGFGGGVYFDYDYSQLTENVPLCLRGMLGYKYILDSVNVFTFDAVVRYMFKVSDKASFGIGPGVSAGVWYRAVTDTSPTEQVLFLPSFIADAGFDFNPFMVDFKWLINRVGQNSTLMGWELYFGFRL